MSAQRGWKEREGFKPCVNRKRTGIEDGGDNWRFSGEKAPRYCIILESHVVQRLGFFSRKLLSQQNIPRDCSGVLT